MPSPGLGAKAVMPGLIERRSGLAKRAMDPARRRPGVSVGVTPPNAERGGSADTALTAGVYRRSRLHSCGSALNARAALRGGPKVANCDVYAHSRCGALQTRPPFPVR